MEDKAEKIWRRRDRKRMEERGRGDGDRVV